LKTGPAVFINKPTPGHIYHPAPTGLNAPMSAIYLDMACSPVEPLIQPVDSAR
jgi:hypothetical protein